MLRHAKRNGLRVAVVGMGALATVIALLPVLSKADTCVELAAAYVLVLFFAGVLLYGLLILAADLTVQKLLLLWIFARSTGIAAAYHGGNPETLVEGSTVLPLALSFFADALRIGAAVRGVSLRPARYLDRSSAPQYPASSPPPTPTASLLARQEPSSRRDRRVAESLQLPPRVVPDLRLTSWLCPRCEQL
jgi:hypothetical protein